MKEKSGKLNRNRYQKNLKKLTEQPKIRFPQNK